MIRNVQDLAYPSAAVSPGLPEAFQATPNIEGIDATVIDNRASGSTAYPVGALFVESFTANNPGDANYIPSLVASQPLPMFSYGVITAVPVPPAGGNPPGSIPIGKTSGGGNEIRIRQKGGCFALCTTTGTAIAAGTLLGADGAGNLTPIAGTVNGTCLAIAKGALAGATSTPTLVFVNVGGF